jgi:hypothetical protein
MSIVFQTGFDHYTAITQRFTSITTAGGSTLNIGAFGRNSTNGMRLIGPSSGTIVTRAARTIANTATIHVAFGLKISAFPTPGASTVRQCGFLYLRDAGTDQIYFTLLPNGTINVLRSGSATALGTTTYAFLTGVYYHIEIKAVISDAAGSVQIKVNEVSQLSLSSIDTKNTANAYINEVVFANNAAATSGTGDLGVTINLDFDDIVLNTTDFTGDAEVTTYLPTAVGSTNQWSVTGAISSYQAVDETTPNGDTDYIFSSVAGDQTLFTYGTVPDTTNIIAIVPIPFAEKTDAGSAQLASVVAVSGSASVVGATQAPSSGSYEYFPDIFSLSTATGITWTATEWNSIEIGPKRVV